MRFLSSSLLALALSAPAFVSAQSVTISQLPTLPQPSPLAEVHQQVGITDMSIAYSSPARRERVVWGELVPWGEVWRAGANAPTKFTSSTDFTFGGTAVPAGSYSVLIVPTAESFAFHLNIDSSGRGAYAYNAEEDVAVVSVTPTEGADRERMLFLFDNTTNNSTHLTLEWAGMTAAVEVGVDTDAIASAAIESTLGGAWRPHFSSARYLLENGGDLAQAEAYMTTSIAIQGTWWNHWFMAQILADTQQYDRAREHAAQAMELGAADNTWNNFFREEAEATVASWPASTSRRRR